jgi:hypothetical protein
MMGVKTSETCWAVNKRQDNKLEKLLHLVDLFELKCIFHLSCVNKKVESYLIHMSFSKSKFGKIT